MAAEMMIDQAKEHSCLHADKYVSVAAQQVERSRAGEKMAVIQSEFANPESFLGTPAVRRLAAALHAAITAELPGANRLSYARSSVCFRIRGDEDDGVTLLLDRTPPRVVTDGQPAEIEIDLTTEQAGAYVGGGLPMPSAVAAGLVAVRGPVRKYLEVDPILRARLAWVAGDERRRSAPQLRRETIDLDAALFSIETRNLRKSFGAADILDGLTLGIPEGMVAVVLGPSGTGKSVLLNHVVGLLVPDEGDVMIRGRPLSGMSRSELLLLRREIGVMFQDGALFSNMNVYDNVAFPLRKHSDLSESEVRTTVYEHLAAVGLAEASDRMPNELSGGMRKRAGLARALALDPSIILCDEPDSGLDPVRTALLGDVLVAQHAEYGGTMLVVTHNVALAKQIADHVTVMFRGKVVISGLAQDVLESDDPFVRQFLRGAVDGPLGMDA